MPILNKEVSLYPDDLFDVEVNGDEDRNWWVLHTKARQEKAVARFLHHSRIAFYLPLISRMTMNRQRKYTSEIPLFAGYVFVYGSHDEVTACRQTERLANVLPVPDGKQLRSDLGGVLKLIECGAPLTAEKRVQPDQRVRIKSGANRGHCQLPATGSRNGCGGLATRTHPVAAVPRFVDMDFDRRKDLVIKRTIRLKACHHFRVIP
jgi:hypothetical protein